jgi:serine O-acetyltransferase
MENVLKEPLIKSYSICLKDDVESFSKSLIYSLFDEEYKQNNYTETRIKFINILKRLQVLEPEIIWENYESSFLNVRIKLDLDAVATEKNDPACKSLEEVYLAYPGFFAIAVYRLSNTLLKLDVPILPRMMSEYAHRITGVDIHPGAEIGDSFFIDHATGIVIGETTIIKENVKIFQGVTLGGIQVKKSLARTKRHPTIERNVTIYANATILGGDVIIGANSIIGANVCVTESVDEDVVITDQSKNKIIKKRLKNAN